MPKTALFDPISMRGVDFDNRIVVSPMCQYSADDGMPSDWHVVNVGQYAVSGVGLIFVEKTAVEPIGRITPGCTGIWNDAQAESWARVIAFARNWGSGAKMGMQLGHAGRKASVHAPWGGSGPLGADEGAWQTEGPSAIPHAPTWHVPLAMGNNAIERLKTAYRESTQRTHDAGFDVLELHAAHGYLLHQWLSPIANQRDDRYGGSLENRMRLPLELFDICRAAWPEDKPMGVRISATDYAPHSLWNIEEAVVFAKELEARGCDFIDVSSGGVWPDQEIASLPGYQTGFAARIKAETAKMTVMTVGRIAEPMQAETILQTGQADMVALARGMIYDPRWAWHAAASLGDDRVSYPKQYARSNPKLTHAPARSSPQHDKDRPAP